MSITSDFPWVFEGQYHFVEWWKNTFWMRFTEWDYFLNGWEIYWIWQIDGVICENSLLDNHTQLFNLISLRRLKTEETIVFFFWIFLIGKIQLNFGIMKKLPMTVLPRIDKRRPKCQIGTMTELTLLVESAHLTEHVNKDTCAYFEAFDISFGWFCFCLDFILKNLFDHQFWSRASVRVFESKLVLQNTSKEESKITFTQSKWQS